MPTYRSADGLDLHYADEGAGKAVLALGGLTRNGRDFDYVAPHLQGVRLIRPDYRGRGLSAWADPATYTVLQEAQDVLALMDHLGLDRAAILGTSRGGLIAMTIAAMAKNRLTGIAFNDIGPVIDARGLAVIAGYVGLPPAQKTYEEAAQMRARIMSRFPDVPLERWRSEVEHHYLETSEGLTLRYDPRLREGVLAAQGQPMPDLWPFFDACSGLPLALIRGANSDLLGAETADEMARRHKGLIRADVPDRGHVPFLDEPEALEALMLWIGMLP